MSQYEHYIIVYLNIEYYLIKYNQCRQFKNFIIMLNFFIIGLLNVILMYYFQMFY